MQAHHLHQHLVGIGGAVEGAGTGTVVGLGLGLQQRLAAHLALGVQGAHLRFLRVGQARGHRPAGHEDHRQVAEAQGADHQPRHDLVAHAQAQGGVEHVVAERHGGGHGDHVAAEQRQLHARLALGDAVAHGRHAAGDLGGGQLVARRLLDDLGEPAQRLVGRQHVVVGGDDADVGLFELAQRNLVLARRGGKTMRQITARQIAAMRPVAARPLDAFQIGRAGVAAAVGDAVGDVADGAVHCRPPGGHGAQ